MKINKPTFDWDSDNKIATCYISLGDDYVRHVILAQAKCSPEDEDMCSEKTGCEIAYYRAYIKTLRFYQDNEIKPQLNILKQLYHSMNISTKFNENSYENKMLQKTIRRLENELAISKHLIKEARDELKEYLKKKAHFYEMVRSMRRVEAEEAKHKN